MSEHRLDRSSIVSVGLGMALLMPAVAAAQSLPTTHSQIIVPGEDRFQPFSITVRVGDSVEWVKPVAPGRGRPPGRRRQLRNADDGRDPGRAARSLASAAPRAALSRGGEHTG